jgi:hypothetical protein
MRDRMMLERELAQVLAPSEPDVSYDTGAAERRRAEIGRRLREQSVIIAEAIRNMGVAEARQHENGFIDAIFWQLHPEMAGRLIRKESPRYKTLRQDWLDARDFFIIPLFGALRTKEDLTGNFLPLSPLEPGAVPTGEELARMAKLFGDEMAFRCAEDGTKSRGHCQVQGSLAAATWIRRVVRRQKIDLARVR